MSNISQISITILAKNAQNTLKECLEALSMFDEVILLDNQSVDSTLDIARQFHNVKIHQSPFIGFGALKNLATSYATKDWILNIDSDEVLEKNAIEVFNSIALDSQTIYALSRRNLYAGEWIKACGWHPDFVYRLFNKYSAHFNSNVVHESLCPTSATTLRRQKLDASIKHYAAENLQAMLHKMNIYTTLSAQESSKSSSATKALLRFLWIFFKDYFLRAGWRYGYKGFFITWCNANGTFFKYAKLHEKNQQAKKNDENLHSPT